MTTDDAEGETCINRKQLLFIVFMKMGNIMLFFKIVDGILLFEAVQLGLDVER